MKPAFSFLTICGLEELESHAERGVTHVLSIIDPGIEEPPAFTRYGPHRRTTLRFHDAIEPDPALMLPGRADIEVILNWGRDAYGPGAEGRERGVEGRERGAEGRERGVEGRENGAEGRENGAEGRERGAEVERHMLIHCHMGISRSSAAMMTLLAQAHPEEAEAAIAERVRTIRPIAWPNLRMIEFADEILGRAGRLTAAVGGLYARSLAAKPELADVMRRLDRAREVELGRATAA